ncbi:MAG: UbiA family prenyltransferase [Elusimicrobia bacterium]|nr:UbiA family prenyltransferase [Elusimicrobiota bacterium]
MFKRVRRIIGLTENVRIHFVYWLVSFFCIITIRNFIESIFENPHHISFYSLMRMTEAQSCFFGHYPVNFLFYALTLILILHFITGERIENTSRTIMIFFSMILAVPFIDLAATGGRGAWQWFSYDWAGYFRHLTYIFTFFKDTKGSTPGLNTEFLCILILTTLYVWVKTGKWYKTLLNVIMIHFVFVSGLIVVFPVIVYEFLGAVMKSKMLNLTPESLFYGIGRGIIRTSEQRFLLVNLLLVVVLLGIWYFRLNGRKFVLLVKNMRILRGMHYMLLTLSGALLGSLLLKDYFPEPEPFTHPFSYLAVIGLCSAIFFAWTAMVVLNDYCDIKTDGGGRNPFLKNGLGRGEYASAGLVYLLFSLYFAFSVSYTCFVVLVFFICLHVVYNIPPFRLKRFFPLNSLMTAVEAVAAFLLGYSLFGGSRSIVYFPPEVMVLLIIFYFLSSNIIHLKDTESDRKGGVITLSTIFGDAAAKKIISSMVFLSLVCVPMLLKIRSLWLPSAAVGAAGAFLVLRKKWNEELFFGGYLVCFILLILYLKHNPDLLINGLAVVMYDGG